MIKVPFVSDAMIYYVRLKDLPIGDKDSVTMKFDTGAVTSVISLQTLYDEVDAEQITAFQALFTSAGIEGRIFQSATGHEMQGFPCFFTDIALSGENVSFFPFYLILNTQRKITLLGNEFISCCKFTHNIDDDILIERCDTDKLKARFLSSNPKIFDINEIKFDKGDRL